jgi:glycosyltransferase involved in cell wall biosynthesis
MISILISVKNEEKYIEKCLNSLLNQDFPGQYEIIIADGQSTDGTREIIKKFAVKNPITLIDNPKIFPPNGWNLCLTQAKGDFILLFNGHLTAPKDFLKKSIETWNTYSKKAEDLAGVGGSYEVAEFENFTQRMSFVLLNSFFSGSNPRQRIAGPEFLNTISCGLYKKNIVEKVGGFEDDLKNGGDLEFNLRLQKRGYKLLHNPDIKFNYHMRTNLDRLLKQVWNYAIAKGMFIRRGYIQPKALIAPLFFLYFLALPLLDGYFLLPLALYIPLSLLFSTYNTIKQKDLRFLFVLPILYFYVHFTSGLAIILGFLFQKRFFWVRKA